jgi:hypothetical protein
MPGYFSLIPHVACRLSVKALLMFWGIIYNNFFSNDNKRILTNTSRSGLVKGKGRELK